MPQITKPPVYVPTAAPGAALAVADHDEGLHEVDRNTIRSIIDSLPPQRNRLANGRMQVKQRTTLGTADDSYTLDGWVLLLEASSGATVSQETSDVPTDGSKRALKLTLDGNDGKAGVAHFVEFLDCADLRGKSASIQAKLKVNNARVGDVRLAVLEWTSTADSLTSDVVGTWGSAGTNPTLATNWAYLGTPANLSVTTSWATYKIEGLTVGASANNLAVFAWVNDESNDAGDYLLMTDVQLNEGPLCTDVERRPYAEDLARCQRQLFVQTGTAVVLEGSVQTSGSTIDSPLFWLPQPMRSSPTFSHNATGYGAGNTEVRAYNYALPGDSTVSSLSLTGIRLNPRSVVLRLGNVTNGATANLCQLNVGSGVDLTFSAEL